METAETKNCFNPYHLEVLNCPDYVSGGTQANSILRQMVLAYLKCVLQEGQNPEDEATRIMQRISSSGDAFTWDASYFRFAVLPVYDESATPKLTGFRFSIFYNNRYTPDNADIAKLQAGKEAVEKVLSEQMKTAS